VFVKVLFCGLGSIGQRHLRNLKQLLGDDLQVHAYRVRGQRIKLRELKRAPMLSATTV